MHVIRFDSNMSGMHVNRFDSNMSGMHVNRFDANNIMDSHGRYNRYHDDENNELDS